MWKRFARADRRKDSQISSPVLVDTTFDEGALKNMVDVSEAQNQQRQPFERQKSDDTITGLPSLASRQFEYEPATARDQVISMAPTVSSIYSQPAVVSESPWTKATQPDATMYYGEISPPSSPITDGPVREPEPGEVSPIDYEPPAVKHFRKSSSEMRSHIPVLKKVTPKPSAEGDFPRLRNNTGSGPTKWDKYTGEITTKQTGKLGSTYNPDAPIYKLKPTGLLKKSPGETSDKVAQPTKFSPSPRAAPEELFIDTRPPWKGASGRTAIVAPVADAPAKITPVPKRSEKVAPNEEDTVDLHKVESDNSQVGEFKPVEIDTEVVSTEAKVPSTPVAASRLETIPASPQNAYPTPPSAAGDDEIIKPIVPLKTANTVPKEIHTSITCSDNGVSSTPVAVESPAPLNLPPSPPSPADSTPTRGSTFMPTRKAVASKSGETTLAHGALEREPSSRFSWTTYNTDTTDHSHSPQSSPAPPVPLLPPDFSPSLVQRISPLPTNPDSVMNRSRPIPREDHSPASSVRTRSRASTIRNVFSSPMVIEQLPDYDPPAYKSSKPYSPSITPSIASTHATGKHLPPPPTALTAASLIEELNARLEDLTLQRRNILRIMADHNAMQPQNPMVADFRARREADKQMGVWKEELEVIEKAEHDTGLRLLRAWRRKDRDEGADGETFWVRRVTH